MSISTPLQHYTVSTVYVALWLSTDNTRIKICTNENPNVCCAVTTLSSMPNFRSPHSAHKTHIAEAIIVLRIQISIS